MRLCFFLGGVALAFALGSCSKTVVPIHSPVHEAGFGTKNLDSTFGFNGFSPLYYGYLIKDIAIRNDNRIVAAGSFNRVGGQFNISQRLENGASDPSFGLAGTGDVDLDFGGRYEQIVAIDLQPTATGEEKVVVTGTSTIGGRTNLVIARLMPDGKSLDPTFASGGVFRYTINQQNTYVKSLYVHKTAGHTFLPGNYWGKIMVSGCVGDDVNSDMFVLRLNDNGTLDPIFNSGYVTLDFAGDRDCANSVTYDSTSNSVIAAGITHKLGEGDNFAVAKINALDGKVIWQQAKDISGNSDGANSVVSIKDGRIIAAGYAYNAKKKSLDFALVSYLSTGLLDLGFGSNGVVQTDFAAYDTAADIKQTADDKLIVAGSSIEFSGSNIAVASYDLIGKLDKSFGDHGLLKSDGSEANNRSNKYVSAGVSSASVRRDGKILFGGWIGKQNMPADPLNQIGLVARLSP